MEWTKINWQASIWKRAFALTAGLALLLGAVLCCGVMQANAVGGGVECAG